MKRLVLSVVALLAVASLLLAGCGGTAAPPTPTKAPAAPAAPTKAAEPTKPAATSAPTAAPKVDFPLKGKSFTQIIPWDAGGATDVGVRQIDSYMEKELGASIQMVNKPGAGSQVGLTELANAKPDGYTLGQISQPHGVAIYLDPDRKAAFKPEDLQPFGNFVSDPLAVAVAADSPFKSIKDIIDAAKANPEKVKLSTTGIMSPHHLAILAMQRQTGAKFAIVHFSGGAPALTALLGGHTDAMIDVVGVMVPQAKSGQIRILAIMDQQESPLLPGIKTMKAEGFYISMASTRAMIVPAKTPKPIVDVLAAALKKVTQIDDLKKKFAETGQVLEYQAPEQTVALWEDLEKPYGPLIQEAKAEQK